MVSAFPITLDSKVSSLMNRDPLIVGLDEPATSIRTLMRKSKERISLVVDGKGRLVGIITRGDILTITSTKSEARASDIMSRPPAVLSPDDTVERALRAMLGADEWYAPVVGENSVPRGVLGLEHVIRRMLDENEEYMRGIPVRDIMSSDVVTAGVDERVSKVWHRMVELKYAGLPVVDGKGRLVGIITQYDLLSRGVRLGLESSSGISRDPKIREVMNPSVEFAVPDDNVDKPAELMVSKGYGRIPVVDSPGSRRLIGILDREDIVRLAL